MVKTRVISGIVLTIVVGALLFVGGYVLLGALYIISLIGLFELNRACQDKGENKKITSLEWVGYIMTTLYYLTLFLTGDASFALPVILLALIACMGVYVFTFPRFNANQVMSELFCILYCPVMIACIFLVRNLPQGLYLVWLIFISSWVCDTCAYAVGMMIGKHKMAPVLSPKKSIEGAVGGVAGAAIVGVIYSYFVMYPLVQNIHIVWGIPAIAAIGACISQVGDLAASAIKRNHEIKDYGTLIPGHGGIMDRFDSVIFTAPITYFLAAYLMNYLNL